MNLSRNYLDRSRTYHALHCINLRETQRSDREVKKKKKLNVGEHDVRFPL